MKSILFQQMNGVMNENVIVKEYDFNKPFFENIDSLIDDSIRDCHDNYFHTFDHICENYINFTNITNNETVNFTISHKSMASYELNKKLTVARERGFIFNQIKKLTIIFYRNLSHINIHHYLKLRITIMRRHFFRKLSQNREYIKIHCNDRNNLFHFACRQWYSYNNPQCDMV